MLGIDSFAFYTYSVNAHGLGLFVCQWILNIYQQHVLWADFIFFLSISVHNRQVGCLLLVSLYARRYEFFIQFTHIWVRTMSKLDKPTSMETLKFKRTRHINDDFHKYKLTHSAHMKWNNNNVRLSLSLSLDARCQKMNTENSVAKSARFDSVVVHTIHSARVFFSHLFLVIFGVLPFFCRSLRECLRNISQPQLPTLHWKRSATNLYGSVALFHLPVAHWVNEHRMWLYMCTAAFDFGCVRLWCFDMCVVYYHESVRRLSCNEWYP